MIAPVYTVKWSNTSTFTLTIDVSKAWREIFIIFNLLIYYNHNNYYLHNHIEKKKKSSPPIEILIMDVNGWSSLGVLGFHMQIISIRRMY